MMRGPIELGLCGVLKAYGKIAEVCLPPARVRDETDVRSRSAADRSRVVALGRVALPRSAFARSSVSANYAPPTRTMKRRRSSPRRVSFSRSDRDAASRSSLFQGRPALPLPDLTADLERHLVRPWSRARIRVSSFHPST